MEFTGFLCYNYSYACGNRAGLPRDILGEVMKNLVIIASLLAAVSLSPLSAYAQTAPYTSYSGGSNASTPGGTATTTNTAPLGTQANPSTAIPFAKPAAAPAPAPAPANTVTTTTAPAPAGVATTDTQKIDPCKDYMYDINAYNMCQDRMQKYQRLKDGQKARDSAFLPPPAPAPAPAPAAAAPAAGTPAAAAPPAGTTPATTPATPATNTTGAPATNTTTTK